MLNGLPTSRDAPRFLLQTRRRDAPPKSKDRSNWFVDPIGRWAERGAYVLSDDCARRRSATEQGTARCAHRRSCSSRSAAVLLWRSRERDIVWLVSGRRRAVPSAHVGVPTPELAARAGAPPPYAASRSPPRALAAAAAVAAASAAGERRLRPRRGRCTGCGVDGASAAPIRRRSEAWRFRPARARLDVAAATRADPAAGGGGGRLHRERGRLGAWRTDRRAAAVPQLRVCVVKVHEFMPPRRAAWPTPSSSRAPRPARRAALVEQKIDGLPLYGKQPLEAAFRA